MPKKQPRRPVTLTIHTDEQTLTQLGVVQDNDFMNMERMPPAKRHAIIKLMQAVLHAQANHKTEGPKHRQQEALVRERDRVKPTTGKKGTRPETTPKVLPRKNTR